MTDIEFTYITGLLWVVALVGYRLRVARFGAFQSRRVVDVGGTVLVGEDIMQATYWAIDPFVRGLVRIGATANGVTWSAFGFGVGAGVAVGAGWFGLACLLSTISTLCDILDGQVARLTNTGSARGELLDAAIDRYTEFALLAGFIVYARESPALVAIALAALLASFMISYASAKADALAVATPRGLMRRHERATFVTLGAGLTPLLGSPIHTRWPELPYATPLVACLAIVALVGNLAAVQRFVRIARSLPPRNI